MRGIVRSARFPLENAVNGLLSLVTAPFLLAYPILSSIFNAVAASGVKSVFDFAEGGTSADEFERRLSDLFADETMTPEGVTRRFAAERLKDPKKAKIVFGVVKKIVNIQDNTAADAAVKLGKIYMNGGIKEDDFFRSVMAMLVDCDEQGILDIRSTLKTASGITGRFLVVANDERDRSASTPSLHTDADVPLYVVADNAAIPLDGKSKIKRVEGVTFARASAVVQRLSGIGVGSPRAKDGADAVCMRPQTRDVLARVLSGGE